MGRISLQVSMICGYVRDTQLFGYAAGGIKHHRGYMRVDNVELQLPEKSTKNLSSRPGIGYSVGWYDPGVYGRDTEYLRFASRVNLRILGGKNVDVVPLFPKTL